jgi:hypothetical protein
MSHPRIYHSCMLSLLTASFALAQQTTARQPSLTDSVQLEVERLAEAVAQEEAELKSSQQQIQMLRAQVAELQGQLSPKQHVPNAGSRDGGEEAVAALDSEVERLREKQDLQQSEITTHEQAKVESASKFPVKLTGLILMNSFVNSSGVDIVQSPSLATGGGGTTGLSLRQTVLGLDARGPHLFGAASAADVRMDFFGGLGEANYTEAGGIARLRTAHADLSWSRARAFLEQDRPIISPNTPTSLTAIAQPALAWSGNLWNWMPQIGAEYSMNIADSSSINFQAALADVPDPTTPGAAVNPTSVASLAEQSRWPGSEARIGYSRGDNLTGLQVGIGGYFSPHSFSREFNFDAWAATLDYRVPLFAGLTASGSFYRGLALGGVGGGAFKDYLYQLYDGQYHYRPLDDVGGWSQLKARAGERLEFNAAYGLDNAFAVEVRSYFTSASAAYQSLTRNATFFTNVIYSPTAYTLFSFEYRRIDTSPAVGPHTVANVYGLAAGYRF